MKEVKGGLEYWEEGGMGSYTVSCTVSSITKSCPSTSGHCSTSPYGATEVWVRCDNDAKLTC